MLVQVCHDSRGDNSHDKRQNNEDSKSGGVAATDRRAHVHDGIGGSTVRVEGDEGENL